MESNGDSSTTSSLDLQNRTFSTTPSAEEATLHKMHVSRTLCYLFIADTYITSLKVGLLRSAPNPSAPTPAPPNNVVLSCWQNCWVMTLGSDTYIQTLSLTRNRNRNLKTCKALLKS